MTAYYKPVCTPYWEIWYTTEDPVTGGVLHACFVSTGYDPVRKQQTGWNGPMMVRGSMFADVASSIRAMASIGVRLPDQTKDTKHGAFAWVQHNLECVRKHGPIHELRSSSGWPADGSFSSFALGSIKLTESGPEEIIPTGFFEGVARGQVTAGDHATQTQVLVMNEYAHKATPLGKFMLLSAFAAPLMVLSQSPRMLLNLHGRSGLGKTELQKMISGIWGPPSSGNITANSTAHSIRSEVMACRDVPVVIDEITPAVGDILDLVYENGKDRKRVTAQGVTAGAPMPDWTGLMITSSNNSLIQHAKVRAPSQTEAILARSLEVPVTTATLGAAPAAEVTRVHSTSSGWLGGYWASELVHWDMKLAQQMLRLREKTWRNGGCIKGAAPASRMWMSFFAVLEYTASQLAQAPFAQHIDWDQMWAQELLPVCVSIYEHNVKAGGSITVVDKLQGIAADLREWEIDETSGPPHPIGLQVQRGGEPKCRRAVAGGQVVWTVHQTLLEGYMRRNATHQSYDAAALVDEAAQSGVLIVPQNAFTQTTMQRLGAGVPAPCYQFYLG